MSHVYRKPIHEEIMRIIESAAGAEQRPIWRGASGA